MLACGLIHVWFTEPPLEGAACACGLYRWEGDRAQFVDLPPSWWSRHGDTVIAILLLLAGFAILAW